MHFDDSQRATAAASFERAGVMLAAATWHKQLAGRAAQCAAAISLFRGNSGTRALQGCWGDGVMG